MIERDKGPKVITMTAKSALAFFGFSRHTHRAVDIGPVHPDRAAKYHPDARVFECVPIEKAPN